MTFTEDRVSGSSEDFGFFFCTGDEISLENLKAGTIDQSKSLCDELWSPTLCENRTFEATLQTLAEELWDLLMSDDKSVMNWKEKYHSATSTTGSFRKTTKP